MVMAASEMEVKEITGSMDVAGLQNKHLGPDTKLTEYLYNYCSVWQSIALAQLEISIILNTIETRHSSTLSTFH